MGIPVKIHNYNMLMMKLEIGPISISVRDRLVDPTTQNKFKTRTATTITTS